MNYTRLAATALRLITENGKTFTLRTVSEGTYNPTTNALSGTANTDETVNGVLTDFRKYQVDGKNIKMGDKLLLIAASDVSGTIDNDSIIIEGSNQWSVINVEEITPASTPLVYKVQVRR